MKKVYFLVRFSPLSSNFRQARIFHKIQQTMLLKIYFTLKLKINLIKLTLRKNNKKTVIFRVIFDPLKPCCSNLAIDFPMQFKKMYGHTGAAGPKWVNIHWQIYFQRFVYARAVKYINIKTLNFLITPTWKYTLTSAESLQQK